MEDCATRLGPYEIRRELGVGGMGVVHLAWDDRLNRPVAIKTLRPALARDKTARERFLREARAAAAISHPNVTQIHDIGEADGRVYFAMECLEGRSLRDLLAERGRLPAEMAVDITRQAAAGLKAAADRGIVHRDVKPSNLFLTADGTLKVTDFGLAKQIVADNNVTVDGQFVGTPNYISPEQATGARPDRRSDIYSLGVTLYEMLAGRPPFDGDSAVTVVMQHLRAPVPPIREVNPRVPVPLAALIQKMLSKSPTARPQDYDELLRLLERAAEPRTVAEPPTPSAAPVAAARPRSPGFAGWLFGVALLVLVLLVAAGLALRRGDDTPQGDSSLQTSAAALAPSSAPQGTEPLVRPSPASPEAVQTQLRITRTSHERTEDGLLRVHGEVTNAGPAAARAITLHVVLSDQAGQSLDTIEVPVVPPRLEAGELGTFEAFFPDPGQDVGILLELNWLS